MSHVLVQKVRENLLFHNMWTSVSEIPLSNDTLLRGIPKEPLLTDEQDQLVNKEEIVFPIYLDTKLTPRRLNGLFDELDTAVGGRPKRIVIGIVNDDSTVVYYFIHDGVYKPKKN